MIKHNFTFKEIFGEAWSATKKNAWYLFLVIFVSAVLMCIAEFLPVLGTLINIMVGISIITISLVIVNGHTPTCADSIKSFKSYKTLWHFVVASFLYLLIIIAGIVLLILPGLYMATRLQFYKFLVIEDENIGPVEALKKSMEITVGHFWKIFGLMLTLILLNIVGALLFLIGLFVTIPVSILATAYLYRKLHPLAHHS
jgi:uncharacterized membrane protein